MGPWGASRDFRGDSPGMRCGEDTVDGQVPPGSSGPVDMQEMFTQEQVNAELVHSWG